MGGKALNKYGVFTERKNIAEFLNLAKKIQDNITSNLSISTAVVKYYHTKESHGDLDLLIKMDKGVNINWRKYIEKHFNPQAIHNNGGVYSFDHENFQIDFIPIKEDKWEIAQIYYSYDPLGNIMGKTFHKFGLSYGWNGLYYKYRNSHGTNCENILISTNPREIFNFGGYDYDKYLNGFETLEDIFEFVIHSLNFDSEMFKIENLKSIDKKRNRKRGTYHMFLNYLKDNNIVIKKEFEKDKSKYLTSIDNFFPKAKLKERIGELNEINSKNLFLAEKFNGNLVMEWLPELKGKELGIAIKNFRNYLGDTYETTVSTFSTEKLRELFLDIYNGKRK